ncbi:MAG: AAA family ATPase [Candidatus Scalindua sp.]|jgi:hypothetical protein|nr:AAA family ATPase [Candidatus Scalindua sp.]
MSVAVLVVMPSGAGKSTSMSGLDPQRTMIINADRKALPWRNANNQYVQGKNLFNTYRLSGPTNRHNNFNEYSIENLLVNYNKINPKTNVIVLDTVNLALISHEFSDGFQNMTTGRQALSKWFDMAKEGWGLFCMANELPDDVIVFFLAHSTEKMDSDTIVYKKMVTNGRKLESLVPESKFTIVLHGEKRLDDAGEMEYVFITEDINSSAKAPRGMFEKKQFPNDLGYVEKQIRDYYGGNK